MKQWHELYDWLPTLGRIREMVAEKPFASVHTDLVVFKAFGVIEAFAASRGIPFIAQEPFVRTPIFTKYRRVGVSHAADAAAHIIYRLQSRKEELACRLLESLRERPSAAAD